MSRCRLSLSAAVTALALLAPTAALAQPAKPVPPAAVYHPDPPYPASELTNPHEANVVLDITVELDGTVTNPTVHQSGGAAFDDAALAMVRTWTFNPAQKGGKPVRARIQALIHFDPPPVEGTPAKPGESPPPPPPEPAKPAAPPAATPEPEKPAAAPEKPAEAPKALSVAVEGHKPRITGAAGEYHYDIKELSNVPVTDATGRMRLAPGIFLSNEGGEGHAEQVYLRGFDTQEGQEIEFTVDGVPINDSGNPHGTGYADTHFIMPEVIQSLRVLEGPFDPAQGNYAVAGSADFHLGLEQRGVTVKMTAGSFGTERLLMMWGPPGMSDGTFAAAEIYNTAGFGQNRAAKRGTGIVQYEGHFGEHGVFRVTGTAYGTDFQTAGPVREDDVQKGLVDFYGTEDARQGGSASRFSIAGAVENKIGDTEIKAQLFVLRRTMRLLEDFTGFLQDSQDPIQTPHGQRGDLEDIWFEATTVGARASAQYSGKLFGLKQSIELGLYARGDVTGGTEDRIEAGTSQNLVPYARGADLSSTLGDFALYANANLRFTHWLSLRGGVRADLFEYDVLNNCAVTGGIDHPAPSPTPDASCLTQNTSDGTYREPSQRVTSGTTAVMPRGTLLIGPFSGFSLSLSAGEGVRSVDPSQISQGTQTPIVGLQGYEGGVSYARLFDTVSVSAKSVFFSTHVDHDLTFDPYQDNYVLGPPATRTGWAGSGRVTGSFYDLTANVTLVKGVYDKIGLPATDGLLVPYVPEIVVRSDDAVFHDLPWTLLGRTFRASLGVGTSYVGPRPLPYGQTSDTIFVWDANASIKWRPLELSLTMNNIFNAQYKSGEYNYASYFPHNGLPAFPNLVPARAFTAGAPRQILVSLSGTVGD